MTHVNEMDAHRGKSASKQNISIISRWTYEHLDLSPMQVLGAIAAAPVVWLVVVLWAVAF